MTATIFLLQEYGDTHVLYFANLRSVAKYIKQKFVADEFWMHSLTDNGIVVFDLDEYGIRAAMDYTEQYGGNMKTSIRVKYKPSSDDDIFATFIPETEYLLYTRTLID